MYPEKKSATQTATRWAKAIAASMATIITLGVTPWLPGCSQSKGSDVAAVASVEAQSLVSFYEKQKSLPEFKLSVSALRTLPRSQLFDAAADSISINGKSFVGVTRVMANTKAFTQDKAFPGTSSIKDVLSSTNHLSDDLSSANVDKMFRIMTLYMQTDGTPAALKTALADVSLDDALRALNTSVLYDALKRSKRANASLGLAGASGAGGASGAAGASGSGGKTGGSLTGWSPSDLADAAGKLVMTVAEFKKLDAETREQLLKNIERQNNLDDADKKRRCGDAQQSAPTQTCDRAWNKKPGPGKGDCSDYNFTCDCFNPASAGDPVCLWRHGFDPGSTPANGGGT